MLHAHDKSADYYCACSVLAARRLTSDLLIEGPMIMEASSGGEALLDKLDTLLVDCVPKAVENAHGIDYTAGLDELKKVSLSHACSY